MHRKHYNRPVTKVHAAGSFPFSCPINATIGGMDGILVIHKPQGMTSFDVISRLRRKYSQKKFGHAGTLDPMASGVLVVFAGKACKALQFLSDTDKEYIASIQLGTAYDTDDVFGKAEKTAPVNPNFCFKEELQTFVGKQHQKVPRASAKKVAGKKLYDYLREGKPVPDVYSDIEIYEIEPLCEDDLRFRVACSSGTYIRSICRDFGVKTGNLAAMKSLVRTKANGFTLDEAEDLDAPKHTLYPISRVLNMPVIQAEDPWKVRAGQTLHLDADAPRVLLAQDDEILAVYEQLERHPGIYHCARGLF